MEQAGDDPRFMQEVLAGVRRYQNAERSPRPEPMREILRVGRARVTEYATEGRPVLFVPSLINPPYVLDLAEDNSLLRWLAGQGMRPLLLDWGDPRDGGADLSVAGHVETYLSPIIEQLSGDLVLAGYCLGGTMALAAAALKPVAGLVLIAAPWNFQGYPEDMPDAFGKIWDAGKAPAEMLGVFPMEMLQNVFWRLDPRRTLTKFASFGRMGPGAPEARAFVMLEDWANEGPPLTVPAARELFEGLFAANLTGTGTWQVGGASIDPGALDCPVLNIISTTDKIVPAATAAAIGERLVLSQGHVGMIIGGPAQELLWRLLHRWLSQVR
ncbi:MAG: alpha/beta fold hydrolase [Sphingomonadaceae bacterium]